MNLYSPTIKGNTVSDGTFLATSYAVVGGLSTQYMMADGSLYAGGVYVHPNKAWIDKTTLSGAVVISNLTIDAFGHPTDWTTRSLTLANLGYTGATNANFYVHPNHTGHVTSTADGATVLTVSGITGQTELLSGLISTDELLVSDGGVIKRMDISVLQTYMQNSLAFSTQTYTHPVKDWIDKTSLTGAVIVSNLSVNSLGHLIDWSTRTLTLADLGYTGSTTANNYTHPNHTGQITSTGDGATVLTVSAITSQTELLTGLVATDEMIVSDAGVLKRMDISVLAEYMQANLTFGGTYTHPAKTWIDKTALSGATVISNLTIDSLGHPTDWMTRTMTLADLGYTGATNANFYVHPNHSGQVTSTADGATVLTATSITAQTELVSGLVSTDELLVSDAGVLKRMDVSVLQAFMQANLTFAGTYTHPAKTWVDKVNLTGAMVISNLSIDALGHPTSWTTRAITLADLGYTGVTNANYYVHPNHTGMVTSTGDGTTILSVTAITGQATFTGVVASTDQLLLNDGGILSKMDISYLQTYMQNNLSFSAGSYTHPTTTWVAKTTLSGATVISNLTIDSTGHPTNWSTRNMTLADLGYTGATNANYYVHPNHSGQVTSTADGATALTASSITAQTALTSGLVSTDELLVSDGGVLKRMTISVLQSYMQAVLTATENDTLSTVTGRGATTATAISITNATASTTTSTGCLVLSGGLGVAGAIRSASSIYALDFIGTSDISMKENIKPMEPKFLNTNYKNFNFKGTQDLRVGVIAQELEIEYPEYVRKDGNGTKSVSYIDLHSAEIAYLKAEILKLNKLLTKNKA